MRRPRVRHSGSLPPGWFRLVNKVVSGQRLGKETVVGLSRGCVKGNCVQVQGDGEKKKGENSHTGEGIRSRLGAAEERAYQSCGGSESGKSSPRASEQNHPYSRAEAGQLRWKRPDSKVVLFLLKPAGVMCKQLYSTDNKDQANRTNRTNELSFLGILPAKGI